MTSAVDPWRLFVAIEVPDQVREHLAGALAGMLDERAADLRFTSPDTWHLTLAFLGDVEPSLADAVETSLSTLAARWPSFEVGLHRAGRFGRGVLFAGVDDDAYAAIRSLGAEVRASLDVVGVEHDRAPLHPHLTIARPRRVPGPGISRNRVAELDAALAAAGPLRWQVRVLSLLRSHVSHGAPVRHEPLARLPLSQ